VPDSPIALTPIERERIGTYPPRFGIAQFPNQWRCAPTVPAGRQKCSAQLAFYFFTMVLVKTFNLYLLAQRTGSLIR
jgi:hypothetical protein